MVIAVETLLQKSIQDLRQVGNEFQFWHGIQYCYPRYQEAPRERTDNVYPIRQQWNETFQRECLPRLIDVCAISDVIGVEHDNSGTFATHLPRFLGRFLELGNVHRSSLCNDILE